jgi:protein SCO1/2
MFNRTTLLVLVAALAAGLGLLASRHFLDARAPEGPPMRAVKLFPQPRVLFVSVDPERDDPDRIGEYAHAFHRDSLAATADVPALEKFARSLALVFAKVPAPEGAPPDSYTVDHSATIAVLDPQGRMAGIIQPPLQPKAIAADLAALTQASFK